MYVPEFCQDWGRMLVMTLVNAFTFTRDAIAIKSLFTRTAVRTFTVCAVSVFIARAGVRRTLVDICRKRNRINNYFTAFWSPLVWSWFYLRESHARYQFRNSQLLLAKHIASRIKILDQLVRTQIVLKSWRSSFTATSYFFALFRKGAGGRNRKKICIPLQDMPSPANPPLHVQL